MINDIFKAIREESILTQKEFASKLGVSQALIVAVENKQKRASKKLIDKLSKALKVHPICFSIPYFIENEKDDLNELEKKLFKLGLELLNNLIIKKSREL